MRLVPVRRSLECLKRLKSLKELPIQLIGVRSPLQCFPPIYPYFDLPKSSQHQTSALPPYDQEIWERHVHPNKMFPCPLLRGRDVTARQILLLRKKSPVEYDDGCVNTPH